MLTTPQILTCTDYSPGEGWFLYWKLSPSLWKSKLKEVYQGGTLTVPINWAIHCPQPDQYDFGEISPEANLGLFLDICQDLNISVRPIIFASPCPFMSGGGLPFFLQKSTAKNRDGQDLINISRDGKVLRTYSFYGPVTYQYFQKFLKQIHKFALKRRISDQFQGAIAHYMEDEKLYSYFREFSGDFQSGFHKYLNELDQSASELHSPSHQKLEKKIQLDYQNLIQGFYSASLQESFKQLEIVDYCFLGAGVKASLHRTFIELSPEYFEMMFRSLRFGHLPSTILLNSKEKSECLNFAIKKILQSDFSSYVFMDLVGSEDRLRDCGLDEFLEASFRWGYSLSNSFSSSSKGECLGHLKDDCSKEELQNILLKFLEGKTIILNIKALSTKLKSRLDIFVLENGIQEEKVQFSLPIRYLELGDGKLILFDFEGLTSMDEEKKAQFWQQVFVATGLEFPKVDEDEGVFYQWQRRQANNEELQFQEIKRLNVFNPSNYKRAVKIHSTSKLAFLRTLDERHTKYKSFSKVIELQISPGGSISLDFGHFD